MAHYLSARPAQGTTPWRSQLETVFDEIDAKLPFYDVIVQDTTQAALIAARDEVIASKGASLGPATVRMIIPPGTYNITANDALMTAGGGTNNEGFNGLWIQGAGPESTKIVFNPTTTSDSSVTGVGDPFVGNLFSAFNRTRWLRVEGMTIESGNTLANAFYFKRNGSSGAQNQAMRFHNINFRGSFQRCFGFDGDVDANQNSEVSFTDITTNGTPTYLDAFYKVGGISGTHNQQNQMLNHWWNNCQLYVDGGDVFHVVKGGHAQFSNMSLSSWLPTSAAMTWFKFGLNLNNRPSAKFLLQNIRFEPKASNHTVIDCDVLDGQVTCINCTDTSSLQDDPVASYDWPLRKWAGDNVWSWGAHHANVVYIGCDWAGADFYTGPAIGATARGGKIHAIDTRWFRGINIPEMNPTQTEGTQGGIQWDTTGTNGAPRYLVEGADTALYRYTNIPGA